MSTPDGHQRPPLRYRRFGGGYRREDVEVALAELSLTLRQLDNDLETLRDRKGELEGELSSARAEIESFRAKEQELSQTMAAVLRRATEIEEGASVHAGEIIAQAEEAATRVRSEASRRIEDSSAQYNELLRLKDNLLDAMRTVVGDFDHAISRVARGEPLFPGVSQEVPGEAGPALPPEAEPAAPALVEPPAPPPTPEPVLEAPAAPVPDAVSVPAVSTPVAPLQPPAPAVEPTPPVDAPAEDEPVFETRVELDAGPFSDFAALSAFERALAHLPKVEDVYVRRLADDRALIELMLSEVAPILKTMHEALPYALDVRSVNRSKIVLDVAVQAPAGAR